MTTETKPSFVTHRACKSWPTLAFIDHPNNPEWSIRFSAPQDDRTMLAVEYIDHNGECMSWDLVEPRDKRCHNSPELGGFWDITLYLVGRYTIKPAPYSHNVALVVTSQRPIQSRNALRPTER